VSPARKHKREAPSKARPSRSAQREHAAPKAEAAAKPDSGKAETDAPKVDKAGEGKGHSESAPKSDAPPPPPVQASEADVRKEGDTQVKTMEFSGLDIEGQLKTPQMLYFLNRLRAEFGHPRLPHRSFMPELERSTKENAF
jgi:hypothetical protein